jgi:hypothetical protein
MADTPPTGDPVKPEALENNVTPPAAAPVANAVDTAEVERLRKEIEQANLRTRQLENEKAAREKAEAEAKAKELETQQQFKTLAEQEKARADAAEATIATNTKNAELKSETDKLFTDYSPEVRKLAETTGLTLTDTDESTVTAFKAKLDEIKGMVGGQKVTPNNPNQSTPQGPSLEDADGMIKTPLMNSPDKLDEYFKAMPGIRSMMGPVEE